MRLEARSGPRASRGSVARVAQPPSEARAVFTREEMTRRRRRGGARRSCTAHRCVLPARTARLAHAAASHRPSAHLEPPVCTRPRRLVTLPHLHELVAPPPLDLGTAQGHTRDTRLLAMFGRPANPYDEVVGEPAPTPPPPRPTSTNHSSPRRHSRLRAAKATDEKQTEINWEVALNVCDKVNDDGETGCVHRLSLPPPSRRACVLACVSTRWHLT